MHDWNESAAALLAARTIDEIADDEGALEVADIAARLQIPETHAERIINRLSKVMGYLERLPDGKLALTSKVADPTEKAWRDMLVREFTAAGDG
jgi:DNA-binding IclR family transcriptional regulator